MVLYLQLRHYILHNFTFFLSLVISGVFTTNNLCHWPYLFHQLAIMVLSTTKILTNAQENTHKKSNQQDSLCLAPHGAIHYWEKGFLFLLPCLKQDRVDVNLISTRKTWDQSRILFSYSGHKVIAVTESANLAPTLHAINYNVGIGACFIGATLVFALISWIFTCSGYTVLKNV